MPVLTFVHERLTIVCFLLIKPRASPVGEKALFFSVVVVVVVRFSPFENKAGPTDGRTSRRAYGLTDTYSYKDV